MFALPSEMTCRHCGVAFHARYEQTQVGSDDSGHWEIVVTQCAASDCRRLNIWARRQWSPATDRHGVTFPRLQTVWVHPKHPPRKTLPESVPESIARPYAEAAAVFEDSLMASAALSRRCLQTFIREELGIKRRNLEVEIAAVIETQDLPTDLAADLDAVRQVGNFAAHPVKSEHSGELAEVEEGEAEWLLEVLDELFEHHYVRRAARRERRARLNEKLRSFGKPTLAGDADGGE